MEKWEYKIIKADPRADGTLDTGNFNMVLNQQGSVGWELVSCFTSADAGEVIAVLKRKINSGSAAQADQSSDNRERGSAFSGKKFRPGGEDSRTYGDKPRTYGKGSGYKENGSRYTGKDSSYAGKDSGYAGKSSGYTRKGPGSSGKSFGYKGKGSRVKE